MQLTKKIGEEEVKEPTHIDNFIDYGTSFSSKKRSENEDYARWVLNHFRLSAQCKMAFNQFMEPFKLFCEFEGKKYRVIGASRLGDVWLTADFSKEHGYDHRVCVDDCVNWSKS
tara:strand:+ start:144 stop:485 length:342 start_codon:yes stop_codon:yes gene_type:complete